MPRAARHGRLGSFGGVLAVLCTVFLAPPLQATVAPAVALEGTAPIAGVVRAAGRPLAKIPLLIRGLSGAAASVARLVKSEVDGTFCWADAPAGVYTVVAVVPGFRPAVHQILHRVGERIVSFVPFELERESLGVVPSSPSGGLDPWSARAATQGDVLRDAPSVREAPPVQAASLADLRPAATAPLPVRGTVSSLQGIASEGAGTVSETAIEMRGRLGEGLRWGVAGAYQSTRSSQAALGGEGARIAIDVLPDDDQSIRVSSRRQVWSPARVAQHAVDWSAATGDSSRASVSARVVNQENVAPDSALGELFGRSSSSVEVTARYQTDLDAGRFVRVLVGYRAGRDDEGLYSARADREARLGGVAGVRLFDRLVVEGGGTGELSGGFRGITPELGLRLEAAQGLVLFGFASRRFERRDETAPVRSFVGWDPSEILFATSALYRAGFRITSQTMGTLEVQGTHRELGDNFQLILDPEMFERFDALVLLTGDRADELSSAIVLAVAPRLSARFSVQAGTVRGEHATAITRNEARYLVSGASFLVSPTGTSLGVRYRSWEQELGFLAGVRSLAADAVDLSATQVLPIPLLESWGSEWRALFNLEVGRRDDGDGVSRANRRMSGGLSLAF